MFDIIIVKIDVMKNCFNVYIESEKVFYKIKYRIKMYFKYV